MQLHDSLDPRAFLYASRADIRADRLTSGDVVRIPEVAGRDSLTVANKTIGSSDQVVLAFQELGGGRTLFEFPRTKLIELVRMSRT